MINDLSKGCITSHYGDDDTNSNNNHNNGECVLLHYFNRIQYTWK